MIVGKSGLVKRESRYLQDHEQDAEQGDQLLNPRPEPQDFPLQLNRVHVEGVDGHDLDTRGGQPAERWNEGRHIGQLSSRPVSSGQAPEGGGHNDSECGLW